MYLKPPGLNMPYSTPECVSDSSITSCPYAVRVGIHGQVGRMTSDGASYRRGTQVICRTARGLEVGTILNGLRWVEDSVSAPLYDGRIVRALAAEDQLLWSHLQELANQAHGACQAWLQQSDLPDQLLDVEPLLDGRTLYFHFLDRVTPATDAHIEQLVKIFQETVASSSFAQLLEHGCGPGCGTDSAKGCGGACSTCKVSRTCSVKKV